MPRTNLWWFSWEFPEFKTESPICRESPSIPGKPGQLAILDGYQSWLWEVGLLQPYCYYVKPDNEISMKEKKLRDGVSFWSYLQTPASSHAFSQNPLQSLIIKSQYSLFFCLNQLNVDFLTIVTESLLTNISVAWHCPSCLTSPSLMCSSVKLKWYFLKTKGFKCLSLWLAYSSVFSFS